MRLLLLLLSFLVLRAAHAESYPFRDPSIPIDLRVKDLVSRLTLEEKVAQMNDNAPEIKRLNIPSYNWHTEGAHGAWAWGWGAATGITGTTVYPQVIGLAASWDTDLMHAVATATSEEIRGAAIIDSIKNPSGVGNNALNVFAPNINIFRDPRWGRGQETYGEDPFLTSQLSTEYIKGLQGDDPKYWRVSATPKHFAVYSGPENLLYQSNINPSPKDLRETFLPAFESAVRDGNAHSIMCAYGSVDGAPSCANKTLLDDILRKEWGFDGAVVSDCGAIHYVWSAHHYTTSNLKGQIKSLQAGTDLACGARGRQDYALLVKAVKRHQVEIAEIDRAVSRLFAQRFHLGLFDPPDALPFGKTVATIDSAEHRALAHKAAQESMVLLKNQNHFLPLSKSLKQISVIGPNASDHFKDDKGTAINPLLGTYHGTPSQWVTALEGIQRKVQPRTKVIYNDGTGDITQAVRGSEVAILVLGLLPLDDDKIGDFDTTQGEGEGRDRTQIELPDDQLALMQKVKASGVPMVVVLLNGSAVASTYADQNANAILEAWYPGQEGGSAIADVLFGDYNPSGRLPITFYRSTQDLPPFDQYDMNGRTYRYFKGKPLYRFGDGLSYTHFKYHQLKLSSASLAPGEALDVWVEVQNEVQNNGDERAPALEGDEVVQLYLSPPHDLQGQPIHSLKSFARVHLKAGEKTVVHFTLQPAQLWLIQENGSHAQIAGQYLISVGGKQPGSEINADPVLTQIFQITQ